MADHLDDESRPKLNRDELLDGLFTPASTNKRLANYIIDTVLIYILALGFNSIYIIVINEKLDLGVAENYLLSGLGFFNFVLWALYYFILELGTGKSVGKMITKTRVVNEMGEPPDPKQIIWRSLARLIPFDVFTYLDKNPPRGWHDKLSKTQVAEDKSLYWVENN
ncbi:MAG: RDD family protein [Bacteroidetes bacterium]|nr:RDD family protein [Bacteroidota bacterium]MCB0842090.1 RDD family protein [Bacteroidota bacterium]MCB0854073.1 RDD family protein [Bacteroidota bacterium]